MSDASDRRIVQGRIRRLELLLRLSSGDRARDIRKSLEDLYAQVGKSDPAPDPRALLEDAPAAAAGVNGIGGLKFEANAPPGLGRMVAIPLYLYDLDNQPFFPVLSGWSPLTTGAGANLPDESNPTVVVNIPPTNIAGNPNRVIKGLRFRTPVLEWATVRIVGFQVSTRCAAIPTTIAGLPAIPAPLAGGAVPFPNTAAMPYEYTSLQRPILLVKNLSVGGSANLFPQGEYADATVYSSRIPEYAGLRDNPILESPNRAYLTAAVVGVPYTSMTFTMQLIVDILDDTEFGRHRPGPYARRGAQARRSNTDAVSFTTR